MHSFAFLCAVFVCLINSDFQRKQLVDCQEVPLRRSKKLLAVQEISVLSKIADGEKRIKDDTEAGALKGALDDNLRESTWKDKDQYDRIDEHFTFDGETLDIGMDSFLIQKLHNDSAKPPKITYHAFDDSTFKTPLFTRTAQEYKVDFIIFANPTFPKGTGHYVVLRRLAAPSEPEMYEMEDELQAEDDVEYEREIMEEQEVQADGMVEDIPLHQLVQVSDTGRVHSGEEDYADNIEMTAPEDGGLDDFGKSANKYEENVEDDSQLEARLPFQLKIKHGSSVNVLDSDYDPKGETEVIYEAFSINFKDSIHGYISDVDPLQYSFMNNNEDQLTALMSEDHDLVAEGDDDDGSKEQSNRFGFGNGDVEFDTDFKGFLNSIKNDAGMINTGVGDDDMVVDKASPASFFRLPETDNGRFKRAVNDHVRKTVALASLTKKSKSVKWKGCLRSLNLNQFFPTRRKQRTTGESHNPKVRQ